MELNNEIVKLVDVSNLITRGITPLYVENEGMIVLNQKCIRDNRINWDLARYTNDTKRKVPEHKRLIKYDILVNSTGTGTLGRVAQFKGEKSNVTVDSHVTIVRPNNINPEYLGYCLFHQQRNIEKLAMGSTGQTELSKNDLGELIFIRNLSSSSQAQIVKILKAIDMRLEINRNIIINLENTSANLFKHWFIDFEFPNEQGQPYKSSGGKMIESEVGMVPMKYLVTPVNVLIQEIIGGDWGKEEETGNYNQLVNVIRGADLDSLNRGKYSKIPRRFILKKNYLNKKIEPLDLIVEISGGSPTQSTGRISIIAQEVINKYSDRLISTNFCRILRLSENTHGYFIYYWWKYMYDKGVFFQFENGTTGIKNLDLTSFLKVNKLALPSNEIMQKYNDLCTLNHKLIFNLGQENIRLSTLRDTLLPKLLSGEIELPITESVEN